MTQFLKRERSAWRAMHRRCNEPGHKDYPRYGGAGIGVCQRWATFANFLADMGPAPSAEHWLGRLDVTGHYEPGNVIWTTHDPQVRRRQYCRKVSIGGESMTAAEAGRVPGQPTRNSVLNRVAAGFDLDGPKLPKIYRRSIWLEHEGVKLPLPDMARLFGIPRRRLWARLKKGWPLERALQPVGVLPPAADPAQNLTPNTPKDGGPHGRI